MMQNTDPEQIHQQNIEELISRKELRITFGRNTIAEKIDNDQKKWKVVGKFQDGITEGGQNFVCELGKVKILVEDNEYDFWQLNKITVNQRDFSDLLQSQTLIIPQEQDEDYDEDLTYQNYSSRLVSGFVPNEKRVILTALSKFDNFVGLVHENEHVKNFPTISEEDYSKINEFISLKKQIQDMYSSSDLTIVESIQVVVSSLDEVQLKVAVVGAERNLLEEDIVNKKTFDYLVNHPPQNGWFNTDKEFFRLNKFLTTNTLQYLNFLKQILNIQNN